MGLFDFLFSRKKKEEERKRQVQLELQRKQEEECKRQEQLELQRKQEEEQKRQEKLKLQRKQEEERKRQKRLELQRKHEEERKRQEKLELQRKQEEERKRQKKLELQRKQEEEQKRQEKLKLQKKQEEERKRQKQLELQKKQANSKNYDIKKQSYYTKPPQVKDLKGQNSTTNSAIKNKTSFNYGINRLFLNEIKSKPKLDSFKTSSKKWGEEYRNDSRIESWTRQLLQCKEIFSKRNVFDTNSYKISMDDFIYCERILKGYKLNGYISIENAERLQKIMYILVSSLLNGKEKIIPQEQLELQKKQEKELKNLEPKLKSKNEDKFIPAKQLKKFVQYKNEKDHKLKIKEILEMRRIENLFHFTRIDNLSSILKHGLVPVSVQKIRDIYSIRNDLERYDSHLDCTSCSVGFPNYRLFYTFRNKYPGSKWVVIMLDTEALLSTDNIAYYCQTNAARIMLQGASKRELCTAASFESMFCNKFTTNENRLIDRNELMITDNFTTDPQAEILISSVINLRHIAGIYFYEQSDIDEYIRKNGTVLLKKFNCKVEPGYFSYRNDYIFWKKES